MPSLRRATAEATLERIAGAIFFLRGQKVMLDVHLATLYGIETKALIRAVRRNLSRFPSDFMFQLSNQEFANLRRQFGTSSWGGRRHVKLRAILASHEQLARKLAALESRYDAQFRSVFDAIRELMSPDRTSRRSIGFAPWEDGP
jgi:hypothetical protein